MRRLICTILAAVLIISVTAGISGAEKKSGTKRPGETLIPQDVFVPMCDSRVLLVQNDHSDFFPPGERRFKSRLMIMWNLVDYLDLDEDTAASFFPIFNEHSQKRLKLTEQHRELVAQIISDVEVESVSMSAL